VSTDLLDEQARHQIAHDLTSTLFVEAGAGSGKTKSLVGRVTALVVDERVPLRRIAAVTFTEKAAAELRDRLRAEFETVTHTTDDADQRERAIEALDDLDSAAIGTLHSFARRVLSQHPIEAGIPPLIEVLDEVGSQVAFDRRWTEQVAKLLVDPQAGAAMVLARELGVTPEKLRAVAHTFNAEWDRLERAVLSEAQPVLPTVRVEDLVGRAREIEALRIHCVADDDKLLPRLDALRAWADEAMTATTDIEAVRVLSACTGFAARVGQKGNWTGCDVDDVRSQLRALEAEAAARKQSVIEPLLRLLAQHIARATLDWAQQRRREGRLEFHDLLVLARDLVCSPEHGAEVRAALAERYQRLLLDEFQDTDPIQIELATRIAGGRDAGQERWKDVVVPPGRLFVVGDPKQSIYRFRRADISMYLEAQSSIGGPVALTTNFRTTAPLLDWVNHVFGRLIEAVPGSQPSYVALDHHRASSPDGHRVIVLGSDAHPIGTYADGIRSREATDVANAVCTAMTEQWPVWDDDSRAWRPVRLDDIAVLVPARTSLPYLEQAFSDAGIPFRAESSSLVYRTEEVRELLITGRALDDPSDGLALVAALRSSLFGCGDDDLWTWKQSGGSFNLLAPLPGSVSDGHPVKDAVTYLKRLERHRPWMSPSELLDTLVRDRRMLEAATGGQRERDVWRRLRFVVDQARAWSEAEGGSLRAYLAWARRQGDESARVAEAVLPESDLDAVRVLTIHAAKGLEFPVVIVSGMSSKPGGMARNVEVLWTDGGYELKTSKGVQTADFEAAKPLDEQMGHHERLRLLYVACTRARDHLVVSLHRAERKTPATTDGGKTNAELLHDACDGAEHKALASEARYAAIPVSRIASPLTSFADWQSSIENRIERAARPSAISASSLEGTLASVIVDDGTGDEVTEPDPGLQKGQRNLELPPWNKGRYGTAIGRAVHGVMQTVDLLTGDGLNEAVAAQCLAEGVVEHAEIVRALCRSALGSEVVQRAATRPHWREAYVGTTQSDGTVLEGFIDLIYREDDGSLVIADYKTEAIHGPAMADRERFYRPQMTAYVDALSSATGAATMRAVLVFLSPEGVQEAPVRSN
jgi:ATP-dependent exoDNAse (exonuclease V) beta subunit